MKAVIVAGGKGTRIRCVSGESIPKALLPVAGQPIIYRQIELLKRYGIKEIIFLLGYLGDLLENAIASASILEGIEATFYIEKEPLGTAGGLLAARERLSKEDFLVLYGDIAIEVDLHRLSQFHKQNQSVFTLTAHPNDHPHSSDLLVVDGNARLLNLLPKNGRAPGNYRNLVPAALYCLSPDIFKFIQPSTKQDFILDVIPRLLHAGQSVSVYNTPEYLRDMGTPERFQTVEEHIRTGFMSRMNFSFKRPTIFLDRDGVINQDLPDKGINQPSELNLFPSATKAIQTINRAGWLAVVVTNQPQLAKGYLTSEGLDRIHAKLETALGRGHAWLDRIYFCPHHPEQGHIGEIKALKISCECRKPKTGMFLQAIQDLPIDTENAYVIGDTWRDFQAAKILGFNAYGVDAALQKRVEKNVVQPDLWFSNVLETVQFILQNAPKRLQSPT